VKQIHSNLFTGVKLLVFICIIVPILFSSLPAAAQIIVEGKMLVAQNDSANAWQLPEITVYANKEAGKAQDLPVSITAIRQEDIAKVDIRQLKDAAVFAPNVLLGDFGPRRLSNPYFRGIGAGPNNPGVTTSLDGVPQLSSNSASIDFIDVDQIEFARGAQGALFGRNSLGGVININSRRPSPNWTFETLDTYGNNNLAVGTLRISGPIKPGALGISVAGGYSSRDGFTKNTVTDKSVDTRKAIAGKAQLVYTAGKKFEARLISSFEQDDDGDYALGDLKALRANPYEVAHDFKGYTERDIMAHTLLLTYYTRLIEINSISGAGWWEIREETDLDYSANPLMTSYNHEEQAQYTQELRFSSPSSYPLVLNNSLQLGWQAGLFLFKQDYDRHNRLNMLPAMTGQPIAMDNETRSDIVTNGIGVYGQATLQAWEKLVLTAGLRYDSENAETTLGNEPFMVTPTRQELKKDFKEVSPQVSLGYHINPAVMGYASVGRGYKAGGFNAGTTGDKEFYGEEHSLNREIGIKTRWLDNRVQINTALFATNWDDLQLNVPNPDPQASVSYYVKNVGEAESKGLELEMQCRLLNGWDVFGSFGLASAKFINGSQMQGATLKNKELPLTPEYTGNIAAQYARVIANAFTMYVRAGVTLCGKYHYDVSNTKGQDAYNLADFRLGAQRNGWLLEGWVKNAFDTEYIPIAFAYQLAPSGYLGEYGPGITGGVRVGIKL